MLNSLLSDRFIIPNAELGGWVCFAVGVVCLTFLQLLSMFGRRDVIIDGGSFGRDAFYPLFYLRHFLLQSFDIQVRRKPT